MAALYLHHALFDSDPPPSSIAQTLNDRQSSSISSVTLRTTSEYSHPTESLLQHEGPFVGSSAYLDILARQPVHPADPRASWNTGLSLQPDPLTPREKKRLRERVIRKRLRQLRWAKWTLMTAAASWATYNAIRYLLAYSLDRPQGQQATSLALGIISAFSAGLLALSTCLQLIKTCFSHTRRSSLVYPRLQAVLEYFSSASLLSPAITNLVLVCVWRRNPNPSLAVQGRCTWDIDVVWSRSSLGCGSSKSVSWGYWLFGAIVRLAITAVILLAYHLLSYKYSTLVTRPSGRNGRRTHDHSVSYTTGSGVGHSPSIRSSRTMLSSTTVPVSVARSGRPSQYSSERQSIAQSGVDVNSAGRRTLYRASSTRISPERPSPDVPRGAARNSQTSTSEGLASSSSVNKDDAHSSLESFQDAASEGDYGPYARYGRPIHHSPGAYLVGPVESYPRSESNSRLTTGVPPDSDLHSFVDRLREFLAQGTRRAGDAIGLAGDEQPAYYTGTRLPSPSATSEDSSSRTDYIPIVGSFIRRMPTIESLGSREVMSLATSSVQRGDRSARSLSWPPTRANTLSLSGSQPPSRSNSLTPSVVLTPTSDGQTSPSDLGRHMSRTPSLQGGGGSGSKSTATCHSTTTMAASADNAASVLHGSSTLWPPFPNQLHSSP